jgi:hypothetical protein
MMLNLKIMCDYSEEENLFTKYAKAKKRGDSAEAERLSKIIENNALAIKLPCRKNKAESEALELAKRCGICGKPIRDDLTFCSSSCIREYRARKEKCKK